MDIDKLSLKPTEIDKNTGRIVLPKSQEELDRLCGRVPGMQVSSRVKAYMPAVQRPAFPLPGTVTQQAHSAPAASSPPTPPFWQHPFYGLFGFCALVAMIPLFFFGIVMVRENDRLKGELGSVETQNAILLAQQKSPDPNQAYTLNALNVQMAQIRDDVAQLSLENAELEIYYDEAPDPAGEAESASEEPASEQGGSVSLEEDPQA